MLFSENVLFSIRIYCCSQRRKKADFNLVVVGLFTSTYTCLWGGNKYRWAEVKSDQDHYSQDPHHLFKVFLWVSKQQYFPLCCTQREFSYLSKASAEASAIFTSLYIKIFRKMWNWITNSLDLFDFWKKIFFKYFTWNTSMHNIKLQFQTQHSNIASLSSTW